MAACIASAACRARRVAMLRSSRTAGKTTVTASPLNSTTSPPSASMRAIMRLKVVFSNRVNSSGPSEPRWASASVSGVKPEMSAKSTAAGRRPARASVGGTGAASASVVRTM